MNFNLNTAKSVNPLKEKEIKEPRIREPKAPVPPPIEGDYRYVITLYKNGLTVFDRHEMSMVFKCKFREEKRGINLNSAKRMFHKNIVKDEPKLDYDTEINKA